MDQSTFPTEFGIFYPTGWIVAAFADRKSAEQVQRDLSAGGYTEEDCKLATADEVLPKVQAQLADAGWLARLGKADEMVQRHLDAAKQDNVFLVIYAPTDAEAERVMNVNRRVPFEFAHRYRRFAIQVMQ